MNVFLLTFTATRPLLNLILDFQHCTQHFFSLYFPNTPCPPHSHFGQLSQLYILLSQSASTIFRMLNQMQIPLSELLAFICGIIKMLHKMVSEFFLHISHIRACVCVRGRNAFCSFTCVYSVRHFPSCSFQL